MALFGWQCRTLRQVYELLVHNPRLCDLLPSSYTLSFPSSHPLDRLDDLSTMSARPLPTTIVTLADTGLSHTEVCIKLATSPAYS